MGTTKEQRAAACTIIEKFTAENVTFPADFVLALLCEAGERDEAIRERDAAIVDATAFANMAKDAEQWALDIKKSYFSMLDDAGVSNVQEVINERNGLAERVRELEGEVEFWQQDDSTAQRLFIALETAEVKLAVAVEALEAIGYSWGHGGAHDIAKSSLAKIKGSP